MLVLRGLRKICLVVILSFVPAWATVAEVGAQTLALAEAHAVVDNGDWPPPAASTSSDVFLHVSVTKRRLTVYGADGVLHRFPVGVGTGEYLARGEVEGWRFTTPVGRFAVGRKKKDPVWYAPDWHYIEKGLPVPPAYSPERYFPGMLGDYALYISDEIAIHGTRQERSVGRASSHGCLRMRNEDIAIVFDLVAIGTPVIITP